MTNQEAFEKFTPTQDGAYATCRLLDSSIQDTHQEWAERGTIDGKKATVYYIFENSEAEVEDGSDIPFDEDHLDRFEIDEE